MVIVEVEPSLERLVAAKVGAVDADVGPFVGEGAVEAFDFAVGLRRVGLDAGVNDAEV